jgi:hypothetical protein
LLGVALLNPLLILIAGLAGVGVAHIAGFNPHTHELILASIAALLASEAAVLPHLLKTEASPVAAFQASLYGTIIHLLLFLIQGASIMFLLKPNLAFIWWLMPMYWVTLVGVCSVFIRAMRSPAESTKTASN